MTSATYRRYLDLLGEMARASQAHDHLAYQQAEDQFRALPGRPQGLHPELDLAVPVIQDTGNRIISIGSTR